MTQITDEEWARVQEALVKGGLRECIDDILSTRPSLRPENLRLINIAYDDGQGGRIMLVPTDDPPWFAGMYEDHEVMLGMEYDGTLYSIVHLSGGGLSAVVVGEGLVENEAGEVFRSVAEAKAYVKGLTAAK